MYYGGTNIPIKGKGKYKAVTRTSSNTTVTPDSGPADLHPDSDADNHEQAQILAMYKKNLGHNDSNTHDSGNDSTQDGEGRGDMARGWEVDVLRLAWRWGTSSPSLEKGVLWDQL